MIRVVGRTVRLCGPQGHNEATGQPVAANSGLRVLWTKLTHIIIGFSLHVDECCPNIEQSDYKDE